jgi:sodium-dependent dicarboxylate transporter 2/3/5
MKFRWLVLAVVVFIFLILFPLIPTNPKISNMIAIIIFMGILWLTEAIPIGITAMLPLLLYPILHIANSNETAVNYFNSTIFLFLGGFIVSIAIEKVQLHQRIALSLLRILGRSKDGILLAFAISPWFISMFISNTATALIMLPIVISIASQTTSNLSESDRDRFAKALLFAVAYSSSIGGIATLIGTPPNLVFHKIYQINFPNLPEITFAGWAEIAIPISILLLISEYLLLRILFLRKIPTFVVDEEFFREKVQNARKMSDSEWIVLIVFILTCFLWIFRVTIDLGSIKIPGWADLLGLEKYTDDATVAIFSSILLFILPEKFKQPKNRILNIHDLSKVPWDIILLFGGGFAIADGFTRTGLSDYLAKSLAGISHLPPYLLILIVSTIVVATTEFSSNTAVASTFLPIVASLSKALGIAPIKLMIPATISSSLAFMLPISTPPNAIVFATGKIRIPEMAKVGITLNIIGIIIITIYFAFLF